MFVEINGELVNTNAIAKATFVARHEVKEDGKPAHIEPAHLVIFFSGNHPPAMKFEGADAGRVWADLRGYIRPPAAARLETK